MQGMMPLAPNYFFSLAALDLGARGIIPLAAFRRAIGRGNARGAIGTIRRIPPRDTRPVIQLRRLDGVIP